jgi:hypothetical protein
MYELYCPNTMNNSPFGGFQKMYYPNILNLPQTGFWFASIQFKRIQFNSKEKINIISLFYIFFKEIINVTKARLSLLEPIQVMFFLIISFEWLADWMAVAD